MVTFCSKGDKKNHRIDNRVCFSKINNVIRRATMSLQKNIRTGYECGFSFTPLNGKKPTLPSWQKRPRESLDEAIEYAKLGNVGLRTGKWSAPEGRFLIVIDQDAGGTVFPLKLPTTVTAKTGKGKHFYFYANKDLKNTAGKLREKIDTRGHGGQVVYPGSIHPETGNLYEFLPGLSPSDINIADLPEHIYGLMSKKKPADPLPVMVEPTAENARGAFHDKWQKVKSQKYAVAALQRECSIIRTATEGTRNDILNTAAFNLGTLVGAGQLDGSEAEERLIEAGMAVGLQRSECWATIESGLKAGKDRPRQKKVATGAIQEKAAQGRPELMTDKGNALRMIVQHGQDVRFCAEVGKWLIWEGKYWIWDDTLAIMRMAMKTADAIWDEVKVATDEEVIKKLTAWAMKSQGVGRLEAMMRIARSLVPVKTEVLDNDRYLFNVQNGTVNLRTGRLQPHQREDMITLMAPVEHNVSAECPLWLKFLWRVMDENDDLIHYLQQLAGYALSGDISSEIFPIMYGGGNNGKSKFLDTLSGIMGPYASVASVDLFMESNQSQHATDLAALMGKRLVLVSETEEGKRLKVSLIKQVTGSQKITARFMRQDNFSFNVTHKIIMETNHKPGIKNASTGIWRRIKLIPWTITIPPEEIDYSLFDKLKNEWSGILNWIITGFAMWRDEGGFCSPLEMVDATESYRSDYDMLADWMDEYCLVGDDLTIPVSELRESYVKYCEKAGIKYPMKVQTYNERLEQTGLTRCTHRENGKVYKGWEGLTVKPQWNLK